MTIEKAIDFAKLGGYEKEFEYLDNNLKCEDMYAHVFTDPKFWVSLGKAMGWGEMRVSERCSHDSCYEDDCSASEFEQEKPELYAELIKDGRRIEKEGTTYSLYERGGWKSRANQFFSHLMEGKSITEFFEHL